VTIPFLWICPILKTIVEKESSNIFYIFFMLMMMHCNSETIITYACDIVIKYGSDTMGRATHL